jgi:hypothetical protein
VDVVLALLAVATVAISVAHLQGMAASLPRVGPDAVKWLGVIALTITLTYLLEADNAGIGTFLALLGSLAILVGAVFVERPEVVDRLAAVAATPGTGPGTTGGVPIPPSSSSTGAAPVSPQAPVAPAPGAATQAPPPPATARPASQEPTSVQPSATPASAGAAPPEAAGPPAGWYPDPQGQARLRYWDGGAWTDQTSA